MNNLPPPPPPPPPPPHSSAPGMQRPPMRPAPPPGQPAGFPPQGAGAGAGAQYRPPPQQQQQPYGGAAALTQQMGGMSIGHPGMPGPSPGPHQSQQQQPQQQMQQNQLQQHQTQKQRTPRRVYPGAASPVASGPPAGFPPASAAPAPGYHPAPLAGPQTFVPGADVPAPAASSRGLPPMPAQPAAGGPAAAGGGAYEPPKPRIDINQMPMPGPVHAHDQELHSGQPYSTALKTGVPLVSTNFTAVDDGNSNPRFIRLTTYSVPHTDELLKASHMPLGMVVQPLADLAPAEEPVKVIDFGEEGPIRCLRCKTYINPYMAFINGGKQFVCNICRHENSVPDDYFCNLDMAGRRLDQDARPELRNGSVEFVATKDFVTHEPAPATFVFAIDVTWNAVQSGMVATAAAAIRDALYSGAGLPAGVRVAIVTFDRSAHFYSLLPTLDQAQMMVVPDIGDVFVPLSAGFAADPAESRHVIEPLLGALPGMFAQNRTAEPVLGAVVQAAHEALRGRGGKLFVFQTALPTFGPGALRQRDDAKLHNTDKERTLYEPQTPFYRDWAAKLVEEGVCCSLYAFPSAYMDLATLGQLPTTTGGELHSYAGFSAARDGRRFAADLRADAQRTYGSNAVLRIRASDGLRVDEHYGCLFMRNHVDVELAGVTCDSAVAALLQHDGRLDEKQDVYFQAALLYTTADGQRRIRVHNLAVPCTTLIGSMFRNAEVDTSMNLIAKVAVAEALASAPLKAVREKLSDRCVQILTAYRRNCASGSSPGQLILPEAYKLLPLYTLALLKSPAIRGGADVPIDQRALHMALLRQMSVRRSLAYFYPTLTPLHALQDHEGVVDPASGLVALPPPLRASYQMLDPAGACFLSAADGALMLWLGRQIPPQLLHDMLGVSSLDQVPVAEHALPQLDTPLSRKVNAIADHLAGPRAGFVSVQIVRQGMDQAEIQFAAKLVEDRNGDNMTYVDYICAVHRQIQVEVRPKGPAEPKWSYN
ncbi:COPII coat Sec23p-Sfb3p heterodimer component [Coemansia javaensis]|uniref:COPII coat Sec23p-Sfb3p heterodimer component n=1 Tax=Coemansia javaensis TaxID=2761396 RepID=A0A9W8HDP8_9FUNG|nr:COPII coat Sec23p-Sfb3p heterodimer component [Coemansia javaensis]